MKNSHLVSSRLILSVLMISVSVIIIIICVRFIRSNDMNGSMMTAFVETKKTLLGVDVLIANEPESKYRKLIKNKRVALIANRASVTSDGIPTYQALMQSNICALDVIMTPEHGYYADSVGAGGSKIAGFSGRVYSLFGETKKPSPEMLENIDIVLFDLQDVGVRFYTYISTMKLAMEAAHERGITFIVLDRPNPIAPQGVGGNVLDERFESFMGILPLPWRHGLTLGEMAMYISKKWSPEYGEVGKSLFVIPMVNWSHDMWFDETGLPFIPPSPSMLSLNTAISYPGFCLFEGTNLSVGRGFVNADKSPESEMQRPFERVAAPWLDTDRLIVNLAPVAETYGITLSSYAFVPVNAEDGKHEGTKCNAVAVKVVDRTKYDPVMFAIGMIQEIKRLHPNEFEWNSEHFDLLAGGSNLRETISANKDVEELFDKWERETDSFQSECVKLGCVLYDNYPIDSDTWEE